MEKAQASEKPAQYLTFTLAGDEYAAGILQVKEIIEYQPPTRVPQTPASIRGVINLRGKVIPVIDLAVRFGLPPLQPGKRTCIVVVEAKLEGEPAVMGLLADAVNEVIDLMAGDIEPPPPFGTRVRVDYLVGMGKIGQKFVLLLDIDRVLSADDLLSAASIATGAAAPSADVPTGAKPPSAA